MDTLQFLCLALLISVNSCSTLDLSRLNKSIDDEESGSAHTTRSLKEDVIEVPKVSVAWSEERILDILEESLDAVEDKICRRALNLTIEGVRMRKQWAVASEYFLIFA